MSHRKASKVLIVDDEADLRNILEMFFQLRGYETDSAENGFEAFKKVESDSFDAVISDVRMPREDGITLLKKIRARNPVRPIVILVTGYADIDSEQAHQLGANFLIAKPFDPELLLNELSRALGER